MRFQVSIPARQTGQEEKTVEVDAPNWRQALDAGLGKVGDDSVVRCIVCDIRSDNTIRVTDATTARVFTLRPTGPGIVATPGRAMIATSGAPSGPESRTTGPLGLETSEVEVALPSTKSAKLTPSPTANRRRQSTPSTEIASAAALANVDPVRFRNSVEMSIPTPASLKTSPDQRAVSYGQARIASKARKRAVRKQSRLTQEIGVGEIQAALDSSIPTEDPKAAGKASKAGKNKRSMTVRVGRSDDLKIVADNALEDVFLEIAALHDDHTSIDDASEFALDLAVNKIGAETAVVMFATPDGQELYFACTRGPRAAEIRSCRLPMGDGIAGFCTRDGVSMLITDALNDPRFQEGLIASVGYECQSIICAPIQYQQRVYGCLELLNPTDSDAFNPMDLNVLNYIGYQLGKFVQTALFDEP